MKKIEYPYFISGNPCHQGHLNIAKKFHQETGKDAVFVIGQNPNKNMGLFGIDERKADLLLTLQLDPYFGSTDIESLVTTADIHSIASIVKGSKQIIRGVRSELDINEAIELTQTLEHKLGLSSNYLFEKTKFIEQDEEFKTISSSRYIKVMQTLLKDYDMIPYLCKKYATPRHYNQLLQIDTSKVVVDNATHDYMTNQIRGFFSKVNALSK